MKVAGAPLDVNAVQRLVSEGGRHPDRTGGHRHVLGAVPGRQDRRCGRADGGQGPEHPVAAGPGLARKPLARMELPAVLAVVLIVAGVWSLVVWPQFLRRVMKDPRARDASGKATRFLTVHVVLVSISMVLGAATPAIGIAGLLA